MVVSSGGGVCSGVESASSRGVISQAIDIVLELLKLLLKVLSFLKFRKQRNFQSVSSGLRSRRLRARRFHSIVILI